jgi:putative hydrolase of the HAD superfamily
MSAPAFHYLGEVAPSAVLFDLFGTLIEPYRFQQHQAFLLEAASLLGVEADVCSRGWAETWSQRARGRLATIEENLSVFAPGATSSQVREAAQLYERFTLDSLAPKPDALQTLDTLRERGILLALVTNCAPDVPTLWPATPFASRFDACIFSCELGAMKPEPQIFRAALDALDVSAGEAWFVGDGSDSELSASASVGLLPVLVLSDLSNTYDPVRQDLNNWDGASIHLLADLIALIDRCG